MMASLHAADRAAKRAAEEAARLAAQDDADPNASVSPTKGRTRRGSNSSLDSTKRLGSTGRRLAL